MYLSSLSYQWALRIPLHKTRSMRRLMNDNGMSFEQLQDMAKTVGGAGADTPTSVPATTQSPKVPVERLTNFMDVSGYCH